MTQRTPERQQFLKDVLITELGRRRMSQAELSRQTGIPWRTMLRLFACTRDMSVDQWDRIAGVLGFAPHDLAAKADRDGAR